MTTSGAGRAQAPNLNTQTNPVYPADLAARGMEGTVLVGATISEAGVPGSIQVLSARGDERFATAAVDAVRQWRYRPTLVNGRPIDVLTTIQFDFKPTAQ